MYNHDYDDYENCFCQPTVIPVERDDGSIGYVYAHNGFNMTPVQEADRTASIFEAIATIKNQALGDYE
jgi:hypothetical protein